MSKNYSKTNPLSYALFGQSFGIILPIILAGSFGVLYIKSFGGSDRLALIFSSIIGIMPIVKVPASLMISEKKGKTALLFFYTMALLVVVSSSLFFLLSVGDERSPIALVASLAAFYFFVELGRTFWWPILHGLIKQGELGRFFAKLRTSWGLCAFISSIAISYYFKNGAFPQKFIIVVVILSILFFIRILIFSKLPVVDLQEKKSPLLIEAIISKKSWTIFGYFFASSFLLSFLQAPMTLYFKKIGIPASSNIVLGSLKLLAMVLILPWSGKIIDNFGVRKPLKAASIIVGIVFILIPTITHLGLKNPENYFAALIVLSGGINAIVGLSFTAVLFKNSPSSGKTFYLTIIPLMAMVSQSLGPLAFSVFIKFSHGPKVAVFENSFLTVGLLCFLLAALEITIWSKKPVNI
ncbi:MAG: MFS transporter [Bacteriovoracaceae bacterium]|nr:MFS transporter [Bacteriovoracaceae bacterium]